MQLRTFCLFSILLLRLNGCSKEITVEEISPEDTDKDIAAFLEPKQKTQYGSIHGAKRCYIFIDNGAGLAGKVPSEVTAFNVNEDKSTLRIHYTTKTAAKTNTKLYMIGDRA